MRRYETVCIFRANLGEDTINTIVENTGKIITDDQGTIIDFTKWGLKKLAYTIKKETQGLYYYFEYAGTPAAVAEIERKFRIDDGVLKFLTIKIAEHINPEQIQKAIDDSKKRNAILFNETAESEETEAVAEDEDIEIASEEE